MSNQYMEEAIAIRESITGLAANADDETIINNKAAFPYWNGDGVAYAVGDIVQYDDKVYKVLQAHTSQSTWTPTDAVSLFAEYRISGTIEEWVQPDSTNPYMTGDKVTHNGKTWESTIDNNVWEPGVYGWTEVSA